MDAPKKVQFMTSIKVYTFWYSSAKTCRSYKFEYKFL